MTHYAKTPAEGNSWGLTPRETECMRLYIAYGSQKRVASVVGLSIKTVEIHIQHAKRKINPVCDRYALMPFIAFDRWDRSLQQ
jgi:DNA-binding NarL/FixJ family response regulator